MKTVSIYSKEYIYRIGEKSEFIYIVKKGKMAIFQIYQDKSLKVSELLEDAVFGYEEILG